ncbi:MULTISPECIES: DUF2000 domain-containing protein [Bradyrhizobium]|uniref:DUF2000 domain-containing protein n=1 Tax=Bradyrhizobium TaxID=374 RepID=UPI001AEB1184|nr:MULTISPECIES: DUF2000 domain-containing protein [Bradyrhizobium]MBP2427471.1 hypothetical protein [Bradyrhizobium elkanii]MCA1399836.1 DUF2000 domain-containing protein [Bradyrhizobium sp. BRP56]MCP1970674.1 hypothetical protein [Bradyrhizobium elkanii]MCS4107819.1 hypothetical protein [Bradyrhizobium elkanii]WLA94822.1 DUF2000 domain-containing protein [Bradyrhizobium elkanii]
MNTASARIAIVVNPALPLGLIANTVAALSIGIGAAEPDLGGNLLTDGNGLTVRTSANRPVPILQATPEALSVLLTRAQPLASGAVLVPFPQFARGLHRFEDYLAEFPLRALSNETIDGLGFYGPEKWVRSLTGNLKLLR